MVSELAIRIEGLLSELGYELSKEFLSDDRWTKDIKSHLASFLHSEGLKVYAAGIGNAADGGEWLLDLTAMRFDTESYELRRLLVAAESEWRRERWEIANDFHKLVAVRADLKLMIFQAKNLLAFEDIYKDLVRMAESFEQRGPVEDYLFCCWLEGPRQLSFRHHEVRLT